jgi:hypothetical protein
VRATRTCGKVVVLAAESSDYTWARLPEKRLLEFRVKDLGLRIEGTSLEKRIDQLYRELDAAGIWLHPPCYLADEWACPDEVPAIGIPFYLSHPRLKRLERKMMLEVEGGTHEEAMRILRHEAGHSVNYAYYLHRKRRWRELFGPFNADYKDVYRVRPYSKRFVRNLDNWYAQMHPDEDFAETFAVWLRPGHNWRKEYSGWGALEKLEYVDELMRSDVIGRTPKLTAKPRRFLSPANRMKVTLGAFYRRRRAQHAREYPDFYDRDLRRLFSDAEPPSREKASAFLRRRRRELVENISRWSREKKFAINWLLSDLVDRCNELDLRVVRPEADTVLEVTAYLTALVVNYRYTGEFKDR